MHSCASSLPFSTLTMNFLGMLIFFLVLQQCAKGVNPNRPNPRGVETYELRPKNGYLTLVNHGSSSTAAELVYDNCDTSFVNSVQSGLPHAGSKETRQHLQWPETGGFEKQQQGVGSGVSAPNFGSSKDVVVTVEGKPVSQVNERVVVVGRNADAGKKEVPTYVIVRGPKLDHDSKTRDQMVTISLDTLNNLIKGTLFPPSGPSMDHNWYVASLRDQKSNEDPAADQMLVLRVVPAAGQDVVNADPLPSFQEAADGTED